MSKPLYTAEAQVTGGRKHGHGRTADGRLEVDLRLPKEMGGDGDGTNPEQLFAVGYAACFGTVLSGLGKLRDVNADDAVVDATVGLVPVGDGTFKLSAELDVTLPSIESPDEAAELVRAAHGVCPYSRAVSGNIEVTLVANGKDL
ncbi:organic hydroperoxide resistance protein [Spirillospora sp. NPDC048911]|uniref:organic hydroperoxide resistance protein n=1 Tax=Spirillospora sp. NPDC048911 TaxID=3364527 RepID=UPI003720AF7B